MIFTTTVLFDLEKISKDLVSMPRVKSEDTATWWRILRNGYTAYGLDENLAVYRRPASSLSSNKLEAIRQDLASVPETGEAFPACERMALLLLGVARGCKESLGMVNY